MGVSRCGQTERANRLGVFVRDPTADLVDQMKGLQANG
jgi:hypothetical protein